MYFRADEKRYNSRVLVNLHANFSIQIFAEYEFEFHAICMCRSAYDLTRAFSE